MASPHIQPGSVIAGKYRVEHVLGEGGMGIVLAVRHLELRELLAVKVVSADVTRNPVLLERFRREARALMRINSEHVVRTHDIGRLDDGTPFLVMEYLQGEDLGRQLLARGPMDLSRAADFAMQLCEALAHAHALSIVHRDVKPSNLFITQRPDGRECLKVIDFGIAKQSIFEETSAGLILTRTAQVIGSPRYMAPEQMVSARDVDVRADFWSIGVTLFELLSGHLPFAGKTLVSLYEDVSTSEPPSLLRYRPELPEGIAAIVHRCMQRDRAARFPSVVELCAALQPFAPAQCSIAPERLAAILGRSTTAVGEMWRAVSPGAAPSEPPLIGPGSTQQGFSGTICPPKGRRFRRIHALTLLGGAAILGSGTWIWADSTLSNTPAATSAPIDTATSTNAQPEMLPIAVPSATTTTIDRNVSQRRDMDVPRAPHSAANVTAPRKTEKAAARQAPAQETPAAQGSVASPAQPIPAETAPTESAPVEGSTESGPRSRGRALERLEPE
jgi:serine/threonine-protein kinase